MLINYFLLYCQGFTVIVSFEFAIFPGVAPNHLIH